MAASAGDHDALDGRLTDQAGLSLPAINSMLQLEKTFPAVGVNVIRDRRTAQLDGFLQDLLYRQIKLSQLFSGQGGGAPTRANSGPEQGLVGVNIADPA